MTQFTDNQTAASAGIGHNRAPLSKVDAIAAIEHWTRTRRVADALSMDEIRDLDPGHRLAAFARSELEAVAHWLRSKPRESAMLGVLKAVYALSDNGKGYCDMSQERLGRFFKRGRQHINECIRELCRLGFIRIDQVEGAPARISPIVPRIFAESMQTVWLFDSAAPYVEPARPGRKPNREIPVVDTTTPIKTPVAEATTPISKYLSSKTEIPVVNAVTQISYESPVVEEEVKHTGNATSNGLAGKEQARVECSTSVALNGHAQASNGHAQTANGSAIASPLQGLSNELSFSSALPLKDPPLAPQHVQVVGNQVIAEKLNEARVYNQEPIAHNLFVGDTIGKLPSREHLELWRRIVWRWGHSPEAKLKPLAETLTKKDFSVGQWLKNDVKNLGRSHSPETILAALDITLGSMEACILDEPTEAAKPGAKPAHNYFAKQFAGTLQRLRADEHAERVEAQKRQALAEIEIEGARTANGKKLAALDNRIQLGNDAAVKRISADGANGYANGHANGKAAAPAQPDRFRDDDKKVADIAGHWVDGPAAQAILEEARLAGCSGIMPKDVRTALREISDKFRRDDGRPRAIGDRETVSEKGIHRRAIAYLQTQERLRLDAAMKAKLGGPEKQLADGHTLHPDFESEWLCLSREFIAALEQKCPLLKAEETRKLQSFEYAGCKRGFIAALEEAFTDLVGDSEGHGGSLNRNHEDYGNGLQQRAEGEIEKALLELEEKWRARAEQAAKWASEGRRAVNRGI